MSALLLVLSAPPVIAVARAPQRAIRSLVILAFVGVAALATMALSLTLDPFTLPFVVLVGILWALLPSRAGAYPAGRPSWILLALAAVAAATLVPYALAQAELQRADQTSEHAMFYHWVEMSFYAMAIPLLGLLSALRPREYRMAAWCAGVALAVMAAASLALGEYASALPTPWAWAAVAGASVWAMDSTAQLALGLSGFPRAVLIGALSLALRAAGQLSRTTFVLGLLIVALSLLGTADFVAVAMYVPAALASLLGGVWLAGIAAAQMRRSTA